MERAKPVFQDHEFLFRVAENSDAIVYRISLPDGNYRYVSRGCLKITGYGPEMFYKTPLFISKIVHPRWKSEFGKQWQNALNGSLEPFYEYKIIHKSGQERWIRQKNVFEYDADGKPAAIEGVVTDITDIKTMEQRLSESEEKYRVIMESADETIWLMDMNMRVTYINPAVTRTRGFTLEELQAMPLEKQLTPESFNIAVNTLVEKLITERLADKNYEISDLMELEFYRKDGSTFWGEIRISLLRDRNGKPKGFLGVGRDITERKMTEQALKRSEEKYRNIFDNASLGIFRSSPNGYYLEINNKFAEISGYDSPNEMMAAITDIKRQIYVHPENRERIMSLLAEKGNIYGFETELYHKDDHHIWISINAKAVKDDKGDVLYYEGTVEDITARKRAEEEKANLESQLQQAQKLESIGVLAGGIAHDFNNMLTVIIGNTELAMMDISGLSPAMPRLQNISKVALNAASLCKQMLAYSGRGVFYMEPLNISELIREMEQMLLTSISKKARLDFRLDGELPLIRADLSQMQQVVMNLVINASEAIGERPGNIVIATRQMYCTKEYLKTLHVHDVVAEGRYVCIEVSDTGCGMDRDTMGKIFDPFFTTKFTGRGLGLAAVLGIVKSHGGALKIYSETGKGTTFKILLPVEEAVGYKTESEKRPSEGWIGSGTVLLVDDDEQIRNTCSKMLEKIGFDVLTAVDGADAVNVFMRNRNAVKCVILDLTMPKMDGREAYREMLLIDPGVRVIISSGYNEAEVMKDFIGKGLVGFIQKPYLFDNLKKELRKVLGG